MIPKNENDLIVVDLEMTGLQVKTDRFWKSVLSESMRIRLQVRSRRLSIHTADWRNGS